MVRQAGTGIPLIHKMGKVHRSTPPVHFPSAKPRTLGASCWLSLGHIEVGWQRRRLGFQIKESAFCFSHLNFSLQMLKGKPAPLELKSRTLGKKEHVKACVHGILELLRKLQALE